jgi:hypothetical protein
MRITEIFRILVEMPWIVSVTYWIGAAVKTRATRRKESSTSRYGVLLLEIVGYVLAFSDSAGVGFLGIRFISRTGISNELGSGLSLGGMVCAMGLGPSPTARSGIDGRG